MWKKIGIVLILIGVFLVGYEFYGRYQNKQSQLTMIEQYEKAFAETPTQAKANGSDKIVDNGRADSVLSIPSIGMKMPVLKGGVDAEGKYNERLLAEAPAALNDVDLNTSNYVIAGHNTMYKDDHFSALLALKGGEEAYIFKDGYTYKYEIQTPIRVQKTDTWVMNQEGKAEMTLITCETPQDNGYRVIIKGNLLSVSEGRTY